MFWIIFWNLFRIYFGAKFEYSAGKSFKKMENCKRNTKFPAVDEGNLSVIERLLPSAAFPHHIPDSGVGFTDSGGLSRIKRLRCRVIFFLQKFNFYRTIYFVRTDAHLHIDLCKFESFAYFIEFAPNF